jgi:integrase/recombinase XerD
MSKFAPTLEAFFIERLMNQRRASAHTVSAYRDTFRLLLTFIDQNFVKAPSELDFNDLDAKVIGAFLDHLEHERGNSVRTRNSRLAAIHSLFRYAALKHPEHSALIPRVLEIPFKRGIRTDVSFLDRSEIDALLAAPDQTRWIGRRDYALLVTAVQTGLRVSELTGLHCADVTLGKGANVQCLGKGRKQRCTPLTTETVAVIRAWLDERRGESHDPLFPTSRGRPLSRGAVALLVSKYARIARENCPSLKNKTVSPHVLRHSAAMALLHAGVDITVIALWLGHESVETSQIYIHADLSIKERALARTAPLGTTPGRYLAPDSLLAFLEGL